MQFTKAQAVPNKPSGDYYSGKLQLIVPLPHGLVAGDWVKVTGSVYNGTFRVTDYYDNQTAGIAAIYFGDQYFTSDDSGTLEKLNYNPVATQEVAPPPTYSPGTLSDAEYRQMIWDEMGQISTNQTAIHQTIINGYKSAGYGYRQYLALYAIKSLKEKGVMPIDQYGSGLWGAGTWVKANYAYDEYVSYDTSAPTTPQPGYGTAPTAPETTTTTTTTSSTTTAIVSTNPNPGASTLTNPNPGATTTVSTPTTTTNVRTIEPIDTDTFGQNNEQQTVTETPVIQTMTIPTGSGGSFGSGSMDDGSPFENYEDEAIEKEVAEIINETTEATGNPGIRFLVIAAIASLILYLIIKN